jgi:hypothetical protein
VSLAEERVGVSAQLTKRPALITSFHNCSKGRRKAVEAKRNLPRLSSEINKNRQKKLYIPVD